MKGTELESIEDGWRSYALLIVPKDASPEQRQETRRAFYAGVAHWLDQTIKIGNPDVSEARGVEHLTAVHAEMKEFLGRVGKVAGY